MLRLPDAWVWDSWYVAQGQDVHAFYLKASRALIDKDRRHHRASIGHAASSDLVDWHELPDALVHSDGPAFDDLATWTGSVVTASDGEHHLFYTGISRAQGDAVQRIGHATSRDLTKWHRLADATVSADPRWYATLGEGRREHWRDPWVFPLDEGWGMFITAEDCEIQPPLAGCVAMATSPDLVNWTVQPPAVTSTGFGQLEVTQVVEVDGYWVLVWCMQASDFGRGDVAGDGNPPITGTWSAPAESATGPFDLDRAEPIRVDGLYAGRVLVDAALGPVLLAFVDVDHDHQFGGWITDPIALALTDRGTLQPRR